MPDVSKMQIKAKVSISPPRSEQDSVSRINRPPNDTYADRRDDASLCASSPSMRYTLPNITYSKLSARLPSCSRGLYSPASGQPSSRNVVAKTKRNLSPNSIGYNHELISNIKSILKDSDSQCSRETRSNFLPSGSMSLTLNMSSNKTPAMPTKYL
uniref:Uncharacterized protein n=1 Tax=Glossina pallidipes TaxID=7398 RepID=A0A1A9ZDV6_GLOPL